MAEFPVERLQKCLDSLRSAEPFCTYGCVLYRDLSGEIAPQIGTGPAWMFENREQLLSQLASIEAYSERRSENNAM